MDCIVWGVAKSQPQLSDFHFSLNQPGEAVPADGPAARPMWLPRPPPLSLLGVQASPGSSKGVKPRGSSQRGK